MNFFSAIFNAKIFSKFLIIHYTGMKKESAAIKRLQDPKSKVSAHYLIKNNGVIINLVPDLYEAWHAGVSSWKHFTSLNKNSIGIEITNPGHQYGYRNFSSKQIIEKDRLQNANTNKTIKVGRMYFSHARCALANINAFDITIKPSRFNLKNLNAARIARET